MIRVVVETQGGRELARREFGNVIDANEWIKAQKSFGVWGRCARWIDDIEARSEGIDVRKAAMSRIEHGFTTHFIAADYVIHISAVDDELK